MNRLRCEKVWQAEAGEDGRLEPKDLASFERHASSCRDCAAELETLRQIAERMKALPEPERTDLEHRRARSELLRRANEQFVPVKPSRIRWTKIALAAAAAASLSVLALQYMHTPQARSPQFQVADVAHAVWHVETIASTSRVTLESGTASFHVEHLQKDARFFVDMPDGRIEVRGTRFVVDVAEGKTRSVQVQEGLVMLELPRFQGLLHAGDRWPQAIAASKAETTAPISSAEVPNDASEAGSIPTPVHAPKSTPAHTPTPTLSAIAIDSAEPPPAPKDESGPRFAEAMQAFSSGEDARADQLFAAFIRDFPRDGRAEDAMFLRAKSRARRGDMAGAAAIAREYLKAFPKGFRRPEAERLAGEH